MKTTDIEIYRTKPISKHLNTHCPASLTILENAITAGYNALFVEMEIAHNTVYFELTIIRFLEIVQHLIF
jgi:hypothetical protein